MLAKWGKTEVEHWVAVMCLRSQRRPALARRLLQILQRFRLLLHCNCRRACENGQLLSDAEGLLLALLGVRSLGRALVLAASWTLRLDAALQRRRSRLSLLGTVVAIADCHACREYLIDVLLSGSSFAQRARAAGDLLAEDILLKPRLHLESVHGLAFEATILDGQLRAATIDPGRLLPDYQCELCHADAGPLPISGLRPEFVFFA